MDTVNEPVTPEPSALNQLDRAEYSLVRALARSAGLNFTRQMVATPYGVLDDVLLTAAPRENDDPSLREAAASADRVDWQEACDAEHDNLVRHDAFELVPEDTLPSWNPRTGRASEVCDTLWVRKQKRGALNEKTKKKGRICFNGAMQKATAAHRGTACCVSPPSPLLGSAPKLSTLSNVGPSNSTPISRSNPRMKTTSHAAREAAMISASVDESATDCWRLLPNPTVALAYVAHQPVVE
jgi:hypothetical protein